MSLMGRLGGFEAQKQMVETAAMEARTLTYTERLRMQRTELQSRLDKINKCLEVLEKHPEVTEVLDTITKYDF